MNYFLEYFLQLSFIAVYLVTIQTFGVRFNKAVYYSVYTDSFHCRNMQLTLDGASSVSADEQQISRSFGKKRQHNEREKRRKRLQQYQIRPQICRACNYRNTIAIISSTHASRGTPLHAERKRTTNGSTENAGPEFAGPENAGSGVEGPFYRAGKYRTEKKTKMRAGGN